MTEVIVNNYESYKGYHNILDGSVPFFKFYNELIESILLLARIVGEQIKKKKRKNYHY